MKHHAGKMMKDMQCQITVPESDQVSQDSKFNRQRILYSRLH